MADPIMISAENKLKPTVDQIQKRFFCGTTELTTWRNALIYRYMAIKENHIRVDIADYGEKDVPLTSIPYLIPPVPPGELSKTVIRLMHKTSKSVTITLYFTQHAGGTLLCQGRDCIEWGKQECDKLTVEINKCIHKKDEEMLGHFLLELPLSFIKNFLGNPTLEAPAFEFNVAHSPNKHHEQDSSNSDPPNSPSYLLSAEVAEDAQDSSKKVIILPPTPSVTQGLDKQEKQDEVSTPIGSRTRSKSRKTLFSSDPNPETNDQPAKTSTAQPNQTTCVSREPESLSSKTLDEIKQTVVSVANAQIELEERFVSLLEDLKTSLKNDLCMKMSDKFSSLSSELENANSRITNLEEKTTKLEKENHSIKTQLGTVQSQLKRLNEAVPATPPPTHSKTPCPEHRGHSSGKPSPQAHQQEQSSQSYQLMASNQTEQPVEVLTAQSAESPYDEQPFVQTEVGNRTSDYPVPAQPLEPSTNGQGLQYNVPVDNKFQMLSSLENVPHDPMKQTPENVNPKGNEQTNNGYRYPYKAFQDRVSPRETLSNISIPDRATILLIGDSTIRHIHPARLAPRGEEVFKICVPGMDVEDLISWLSSEPVGMRIKSAVIHVGVNSCKAGPISKERWYDVINLCAVSFPQASVSMSSIIPARGRHHMNNVIFPTNRNLQAVCHELNVPFIDHTSTFMTDSGSPRLALYLNLTHPSDKGTARLASNLRSLWNSSHYDDRSRYGPYNARESTLHQNDERSRFYQHQQQPDQSTAMSHPHPYNHHGKSQRSECAPQTTYASRFYPPMDYNQNWQRTRAMNSGSEGQFNYHPSQNRGPSGPVPWHSRGSCPPPSSVKDFPNLQRGPSNESSSNPNFIPSDENEDIIQTNFPRSMPVMTHCDGNAKPHPKFGKQTDNEPPTHPNSVRFSRDQTHQHSQHPNNAILSKDQIHPHALELLSIASQLLAQQYPPNGPFH